MTALYANYDCSVVRRDVAEGIVLKLTQGIMTGERGTQGGADNERVEDDKQGVLR